MERTIQLPEDLLAQMDGDERARVEGLGWHDLLRYGREKGLESGYTEAGIPDVVREWRREQHSR